MHLSLTFPSSWELKEAPGNKLLALLPGGPDNKPDAIITYGPIVIKPDEPRAWMEQTARSDAPRGAKVQVGRTIDRTTSAGWPLRLLEVELVTSTNEVIEVRLCAFYTFMEHASALIVRAHNRERMEANGKAILAILETGRPDWRGEPLCLVDVWDLEPKRRAKPRVAVKAASAGEALKASLEQIDATLAANPTAQDHVRRGGLLLDLQRPGDALEAFRHALALDANMEPARYLAGVALGDLGKHAQAIAEWELALAQAPDRVDTHYNLAQARFLLKDFEGALAAWRTVTKLDPSDFLVGRKVVQCLYALERYDEGNQARTAFRESWASSTDPRARMIVEYVFDQFDGDGFTVHAVETLRPANPAFYAMLTFRAVGPHDQPLPATVVVETSEQAKAAGTPYVLGVTTGGQFRAIGGAKELPPYPQFKQQVLKLLKDALAAKQPTN